MALHTHPTLLIVRAVPSVASAADDLADGCAAAVARLHEAGGALDAVVLVGDLTTSAGDDEFAAVAKLVDRILAECCDAPVPTELPAVLAVPGPGDRTPMSGALVTVRSLVDWWPMVRDNFWADETPDVRDAIRTGFRPFQQWYDGYATESGWRPGLMPGEGGLVLGSGDVRLGLVTLNSAFRMLTADSPPELATLHARQTSAVVDPWREPVDAVAVFAPIAAPLPEDLPSPVLPVAGRAGAAEADGWLTPDAGAHLLVARRTATGAVGLVDLGGATVLDAVARTPGPLDVAADEPAESEPVGTDPAVLLTELDHVMATGQAVLVLTSGVEAESRGEWSSPLGSPDDVFDALVEQLPPEIAGGRVTLAAVMQRLRQVNPSLVRRTIGGMLVADGSTVNDTAMRLLLAPWYRVYDCTGTNVFHDLAARFEIGANVVIVDAHRDPPGRGRQQLEVVAMNGIAPGSSTAPVSFDIDDRGRGSRSQWFRQMKADLITHPVVFTASGVDSRHLALYLDTLTGDGGAEATPRRFVVAPGVDATASWKLAGVGSAQIPVSVAELARERLGSSREPMRRGAQLRARMRSVLDRNAGVQLVSTLLEAAPPGDPLYLRGTDPTWGDVKESIPASLSTLKSMLELAEADGPRRPVLVLNDRSGTGKSTTLMQFAVALHARGLAVGWVDRATTKSSQDVLGECVDLGLDAVLIDDVDIFGAEAARLVTRLGQRGGVLVAATIRSTRGHLLDEVAGLTRVPPLRLTDDDLNALVHRLETFRQLGKLKQYRLHDVRVERLRQVSDRDLMAAMVEVITGYRFEQRVSSEFDQLDPRERNIYATVCLFEALQYEDRSLTLPQNALLQIASDGPPDLVVNRAIERLVSGRRMLVRRESGHIRTRHRVVAEAMEKFIRDDKAYFLELFERLLLFYVQRGADITDRNDPTRRAMVALINHRVMMKSGLSVTSVRSVYQQLHDYLKDDFHYWLQCGSYELERRNLDLAATYLETSRGCEGGQDHFKVVTTWAMVCLRRASGHPTDSGLHDVALDAFRELERIAAQEGDRSPHTIVTMVKDGTHWLQRGVFFTDDERQSIARRILRWIEIGHRLLAMNGEFRSAAEHCTRALERMVQAEEEDRLIPL
ncbi:division plane positioning ATPase MipZ [Micromonospora phytophila]|uniref:division plane positioning ATPase MipZ n=1 Tax=Micromonospora phytophila TaxID=709888 RepID=UPI00202EF5E9|nr:division plane positioning ATPase MipZ [Micromonospora phytophila]MCM0676628.1 division plane positioning ATPase MipZ [Micromonospora phytophila]